MTGAGGPGAWPGAVPEEAGPEGTGPGVRPVVGTGYWGLVLIFVLVLVLALALALVLKVIDADVFANWR